MVELRLEALGAGAAAVKDLYVAVRIGDAQKLTRVSAEARKLVFPEKCLVSRSFGKLEVFRHIGSCTFGTADGLMNAAQDLVTLDDLRFRVTLGSPLAESGAPDMQAERPATGRSQAQEYLEKHQLQPRLGDLMQSLLRERPADPATFVSERLRRNAHLAEQSVPAPVPVPPASRQPPLCSLPPVAWAVLHARFPQRSLPGSLTRCLKSDSAAQVRFASDDAAAGGLLDQFFEEPRSMVASSATVSTDVPAQVPADVVKGAPAEAAAGVLSKDSLAEMRAALRGGLHVVEEAIAEIPLRAASRPGAVEPEACMQAAGGDGPKPAGACRRAPEITAQSERLDELLTELEEEELSTQGQVARGWSVWGLRPECQEHTHMGRPPLVRSELSKSEVCHALKVAANDGSLDQLLAATFLR